MTTAIVSSLAVIRRSPLSWELLSFHEERSSPADMEIAQYSWTWVSPYVIYDNCVLEDSLSQGKWHIDEDTNVNYELLLRGL
ncbi:hypothetical protein RB195_013847 [Necator americanus]|uniref:Uncharacterized protein n=1 Tax=Necator americanus TaxID=51031 RepID=A0ABR1DXI1_NECAM